MMLNVDTCEMATPVLKIHSIQDANKVFMLRSFWLFNIIQLVLGEIGCPKLMGGLEIMPKMMHKSLSPLADITSPFF